MQSIPAAPLQRYSIDCLGSIIPVNTYICPVLCILTGAVVLDRCGRKAGWCHYLAVAVLAMLLAPDREAALVYAFLGYYPMLKPRLDAMKLGLIVKFFLFNIIVLVMYWILIQLLGMEQIAREYAEMGMVTTAVTLVLGNATFFLLDKVLGKKLRRKF